MKSDTIELRPIQVRKKTRTGSHVFITILSNIIEKHLGERLIDLNTIVEEGIHELSSINCIPIQVGAVKYSSIPKSRKLGSDLMNALGVTLPNTIPNVRIIVATRKNRL